MTIYLQITTVVLLYWFFSISIVFLNKSLLSGSTNLNAPFFIAWFQCVISAYGCLAFYLLTLILPFKIEAPDISISIEKCIKIFPLSLVFVAMIAFNNLFLKSVGVSFFYLGRSLSTVFSVILTYLILGKKTSLSTLACCLIIIVGFLLGVDQEGDLNNVTTMDIVYGVLASFFSTLNAILTTKCLPTVDDNILMLTIYNNLNACLLFTPLILVNHELQSMISTPAVFTLTFWVEMVVAGIFGLAIGYVTGLQISVTSPLTHNISGIAKSAAQTVMATHINRETKNFWWWVSNGIVLLGSMAYTWIQTWKLKQLGVTNYRSPKQF